MCSRASKRRARINPSALLSKRGCSYPPDSELFPLLEEYSRELPGLFIVSQVDVSNHTSEGVEVKIERARGVKCGRCWKYTEDVGSVPEFPGICAACAEAVREIAANG